MVFLGNPEYVCELQPIDFSMVARGFGSRAFAIEDAKTCGDLTVASNTVRELI
jgi:pyruvate dehydrogenase (quinone)/pyruvate oxidase